MQNYREGEWLVAFVLRRAPERGEPEPWPPLDHEGEGWYKLRHLGNSKWITEIKDLKNNRVTGTAGLVDSDHTRWPWVTTGPLGLVFSLAKCKANKSTSGRGDQDM